MNNVNISLTYDPERKPVIVLPGAQVATLPNLVRVVPSLTEPKNLGRYCEAVNHLSHGRDYRVIHDPDGYRTRYKSRMAAEDPSAPWQEGVARLSDFGVCDTSEIAPPRVKGSSVVFYVEDDFLGIPYRVTAPGPRKPEGEVTYEPLPMRPLPGVPAPGKAAAAKSPSSKPKGSKPKTTPQPKK